MKRDFDLIRSILRIVEDAPANTDLQANSFKIDNYDEDTVLEHIDLLIEANLLEGRIIKTMRGLSGCIIQRLTWDGHDFLQPAKKDDIWNKAFSVIKEKGGAITFEVVKELLKTLSLNAVGLP